MFYIIAVFFAVFGDHKLLAYSDLSIKGTKEDISCLISRMLQQTRFTRPNILLAVAHIYLVCISHDRSLVTSTPRSLV